MSNFDNEAEKQNQQNINEGYMSSRYHYIKDNEDIKDSLLKQECKAIPFIKFIQEQGKFELNPEAEQFLLSLKDIKVGVVAVCGKYRTGKSYLMNKLFVEPYFQKNGVDSDIKVDTGFKVSPTINACTKGLWIWKKVIYSENNQIPMIVIDTEGLGAYDEDETHDAKIFLLALLLSSLIIYNSIGPIDESALSNLSLVINLSKKIQLRNKAETVEDVDELASIFPTFLWVLRDFSLQLEDTEGNKITSKQYFENALRELKGCSEQIEQKNRIRRLLKHFFQERDCFTLVRPTESEKDLQCLSQLNETDLRQEFVDLMNKLKSKVMTKIKYKVMNGHQLNGPMILELANSYILALNQGAVPNLQNAWSNVCTFQQERAYRESLQFFKDLVVNKIKNCIEDIGSSNLKQALKEISDQSILHLKSDFLGDQKTLQNFQEKLENDIAIQQKLIKKELLQKIDQIINQFISQVFNQQIEQKVRKEIIKDSDTLFQEIEQLLTDLQVKFVNDCERVEILYRKFVQQRLPRVVESLMSQERIQWQVQIKFLEEKLKIADKAYQDLKLDNKNALEQMTENKERLQKERQELIQKEKFLESKVEDLNDQLEILSRQLKYLQSKEMNDIGTETQKYEQTTIVLVQDFNIMNCEIINEETEERDEELDDNSPSNYLSQDVIPQSDNELSLQRTSEMQTTIENPFIELNTVILKEILNTLNNNNNQKNMSQEFQQIIKNNQLLTNSLEQSERSYRQLAKKLEKKGKYELLVKNCQRLQCGDCNKLYTANLFATHIQLCKKQQQSLRKSLCITDQSFSSTQKTQSLEQKQEDQSHMQSQDGLHQLSIKIVDMNHVYLPENTISMSPMKHMQTSSSVEFKFQVFYKGAVWFVNKGLQKIKISMRKIQRDQMINRKEQTQFARWVLEIDRNEKKDNYKKMIDITEQFFTTIQKKIVDKKYPLNKEQAIFSKMPQYVIEFIEFFQISEEKYIQSLKNENMANDDEPVISTSFNETELFNRRDSLARNSEGFNNLEAGEEITRNYQTNQNNVYSQASYNNKNTEQNDISTYYSIVSNESMRGSDSLIMQDNSLVNYSTEQLQVTVVNEYSDSQNNVKDQLNNTTSVVNFVQKNKKLVAAQPFTQISNRQSLGHQNCAKKNENNIPYTKSAMISGFSSPISSRKVNAENIRKSQNSNKKSLENKNKMKKQTDEYQ